MKIDPDGYTFFAFFAVISFASFVGYTIAHKPVSLGAAIVFAILALYTLYFFRDPVRITVASPGEAISAADGVVVDVSQVEAEGFEGGKAMRIAVFMNVFNVHVNRTPLSGSVVGTAHVPGKKLSAYNRRAEYENEHGDTDMTTSFGFMRIRQIAGLVARRVVTRVKAGDTLERGARIGLIRFGSRVDVFLPLTFEPMVTVGQRVSAGETVIAKHRAAGQ